jgi:rubrerythrin
MNSKQFINKLVEENEALYRASEMQVEAYFASNPSKEEMVEHFIGRMVNERQNMVAISKKVASMPASTPAKELQLLSKQAMDEANHFRMVKEVIEHITGEELNVEAAIAAETAKPTAKGAALLDKYEASNDEMAMAAYQFVAEGRAERVWNKMAECVEDEFIARSYAKIGRDEGMHSKIGRRKLEMLAVTESAQKKLVELINQMRYDLFAISRANTTALPEARELIEQSYGFSFA